MAAKQMPEPQTDADKIYRVTITTDRGAIVMDLDRSSRRTPSTTSWPRAPGLLRQPHVPPRRPEFVIQGGCPEGSGTGGPGYKFADEPVQGAYTLGAVAMANAGPDTNGSQFFICIDDCTRKLTPNYNLFGHVVEGIEVAQVTEVGDVFRKFEVEERDGSRCSSDRVAQTAATSMRP